MVSNDVVGCVCIVVVVVVVGGAGAGGGGGLLFPSLLFRADWCAVMYVCVCENVDVIEGLFVFLCFFVCVCVCKCVLVALSLPLCEDIFLKEFC